MTKKIPITILFQQPPKKALYNFNSGSLNTIDQNLKELCQGFGNYVTIGGKEIFVAVFAANDRLYLLCNSLHELNHTDYEVKLTNKHFKKDIASVFKKGKLLFSTESRVGSFDGDIIEAIYNLFSDKNLTKLRIEHMIAFQQETDPAKRSAIDKKNSEAIRKRKQAVNVMRSTVV